eukprot:Nitzschia sp. Nitz4//scaffold40_size135432//49424//51514//NITZ4_003239-RA/size135432-snap-gene-0.126-mRNA-1//-1//CDS//3329551204//4852//frame0
MSTTAALKSWNTKMVESHGDYRDEMFLEEHIGGPLYENQTKMPPLPIPAVEDTMSKVLMTSLPLAKSDAEKQAFKEALLMFPDQAEQLQKRLVLRQQGEMAGTSWLQLWWNQLGYLQVRDPVVINVSYFFGFVDDPSVDGVGSAPNVQRGAAILFAVAQYRKLVVTGELPCERIGKHKIPLCSTPFKYMFNACRIPRLGQDTYRLYDPSRYTHATVARKGHFFSIQIVHPETGMPLPVGDIEEQLQQCILLADAIPMSRPKLGCMTSNNRDDWARARETLIRLGGSIMEDALEEVESGAIVLTLDDESPVSRQEFGTIYWHGGPKSGSNRWFDKSIQIMVSNNGKCGILGEHSMMDGMVLVSLSDFITKQTYAKAKLQSAKLPSAPLGVKDIFAEALSTMDLSVVAGLESQAWKAFDELTSKHIMHAQSFQAFGARDIKKMGFPPDAFVQMAMQLATYRLFGEQAGTYEATQVRKFLHGRTEVTRSVSVDSEAFIKKMGLRPKFDESNASSRGEKLALLKKATKTHSWYTGQAANAQGADRHMFGLSMLVGEGETAPALFSDPVFARGKKWRVSTSQLTHPRFNLWGYGEVVPDGVGLAYAVNQRSCVFCISALRSTGWTDQLSELLEEALLEMRALVEADKAATSKL